MHCIIISGSSSPLLPCSRVCPLFVATQLVLCHPTEGEPYEQAAPDNISPRVSITACFEQGTETSKASVTEQCSSMRVYLCLCMLVCKCFSGRYGQRRKGKLVYRCRDMQLL